MHSLMVCRLKIREETVRTIAMPIVTSAYDYCTRLWLALCTLGNAWTCRARATDDHISYGTGDHIEARCRVDESACSPDKSDNLGHRQSF